MFVPFLPASIKTRIKGQAKNLRQQYIRLVHGFSRQDLARLLQTLGISPRDVVMVHSAFDRFEGFDGKPTDVISALQAAVGKEGAVLMPTIPFTGTAIEYVKTVGIFDVVRTPSRMGLITEVFRRMPGVVRSIHPTHSVAAWGKRSAELIKDHSMAKTPCGKLSPFGRLTDIGGKILLLGADIESMTFFHCIEEDLEPFMPFSPFTKDIFVLSSKDAEGHIIETRTRLFDPHVSRRRNLQKLVPFLKDKGYWHEARVGLLQGIILKAGEVADTCRVMAQGGVFCYD